MYLVFGATNMAGAHLICSILKQGQSVRAVLTPNDDPNYTKHILSFYSDDYELLFNEIEWIKADLDDLSSLTDAMEGICQTFYCIPPTLSSIRFINDNVSDLNNVLSAAMQAKSGYFCYLSSILALGDAPDGFDITESSQRNPKGEYTEMSNAYFECEMAVRRAMEEGLNAGIVNAAVTLGPGDWKKDTSSFIAECYNTRPFYTHGVTGFVSVNDLVLCMLAMAKGEHNDSFIVCSQNVSCRELVNFVTESLEKKQPAVIAGDFQLKLYKIKYAIKSMWTGRRPIVDNDYFSSMTNFRLYSNTKSINTLISHYLSVEDTIKKICEIYKMDKLSASSAK